MTPKSRASKSKYQAAWAKKNGYKDARARRVRLRELIKDAKNKPCVDCHTSYPWYVMDFDHVRGEKKFTIGKAGNRNLSEASVLAEIAKCDLVCANCHRERTFNAPSFSGKTTGSDPVNGSPILSGAEQHDDCDCTSCRPWTY